MLPNTFLFNSTWWCENCTRGLNFRFILFLDIYTKQLFLSKLRCANKRRSMKRVKWMKNSLNSFAFILWLDKDGGASVFWRPEVFSFAISLNRNRGNSGRPRSGRSPRNIAAVRWELNRNPTATIRRNNVPQVSRSTFNRIVNLDLRWHPYKLIHRHALRRGDYQRSDFCHWLLQRPKRFLGELLIGDEATFYVNEKVQLIMSDVTPLKTILQTSTMTYL